MHNPAEAGPEFNAILPNIKDLEQLFDELWPICRSISGSGIKSSFEILRKFVPLEPVSFATGTKVLDWTIPNEWNISDAFLEDSTGKRILDFKVNNLHVLNYSTPIDKMLSLEELQAHLYSLPEQPNAIPYLTSYYKERWGFCLADQVRKSLKPGTYRAVIKSELKPGTLDVAHAFLESTEKKSAGEFLISTYLCHPSMANNELSGPILFAMLFQALKKASTRRYRYRFYIGPETIGSIAYLSKFGDSLVSHCKSGLVLTCVGDGRNINYKKSRKSNSEIDRIMTVLLKQSKIQPANVLNFYPDGGSDERQFCSPGFDLPVGVLMHSLPNQFPEYHTSLDNKLIINWSSMLQTLELIQKAIYVFENNHQYQNLILKGEPQLGKYGLYPTLGSQKSRSNIISNHMWNLNYSDGKNSILDIAELSGQDPLALIQSSHVLEQNGLLRKSG